MSFSLAYSAISLHRRDQVSHPYKRASRLTLLCTLIFIFFVIGNWNTKDAVPNGSRHSLNLIISYLLALILIYVFPKIYILSISKGCISYLSTVILSGILLTHRYIYCISSTFTSIRRTSVLFLTQ